MSKIFNFFQGGWQDDLPPASSSPEHRLHPGARWLHPGPPRVGDPLVHPATWDTCSGGRGHWRGATPLSGLPGEAAPGMHTCIGSDWGRPHLPPETHLIIYLERDVCVKDITMYFLFRFSAFGVWEYTQLSDGWAMTIIQNTPMQPSLNIVKPCCGKVNNHLHVYNLRVKGCRSLHPVMWKFSNSHYAS